LFVKGRVALDGCSSKPRDRHERPLSAEQLALDAQQYVARSRGRDWSEPWQACHHDGLQELGLLLGRQTDGAVVGFALESRQPFSAGSTTPRLRSLRRRSRVVLTLARVALANSLGRIGFSRSKASTRSSAAFDCVRTASRSIPLLGGPAEPAFVGFLSDPFISAARMALRVSSSSAKRTFALVQPNRSFVLVPPFAGSQRTFRM
jgi:hypothetical protein